MNLKNELTVILAVILLFSFAYAIPLALHPFETNTTEKALYQQVFFILLQIKNFIRLLIPVIYCMKMMRKTNFFTPSEDPVSVLSDFDCVIVSVIPSTYFEKFLNESHPEKLPYWRMI